LMRKASTPSQEQVEDFLEIIRRVSGVT